jgi:hypothetical protein
MNNDYDRVLEHFLYDNVNYVFICSNFSLVSYLVFA